MSRRARKWHADKLGAVPDALDLVGLPEAVDELAEQIEGIVQTLGDLDLRLRKIEGKEASDAADVG